MNVVISPPKISVEVRQASVGLSFGNPITRDYVERDPYTGNYTVTPSSETQVLRTNNLRMTDDITVGPIPQNYGLITWNGPGIRVS